MGLNTAGLTALLEDGNEAALYAAIGDGPLASDQVSTGRVLITWSAVSDQEVVATNVPLNFTGPGNGDASTLLLFSAASGGTFLGHVDLAGDQAFSGAGTFRITEVTLRAYDPDAIPDGFPNALNTGLAGIGMTEDDLTLYEGPGGYDGDDVVVLEDMLINTDIRIYENVQLTIRRCKLNAHVDADSVTATALIEDSHIDAGTWTNAAVGFRNLTIRRCDIEGGITAVNASLDTVVEDSYLHGQYIPPTGDAHAGGFLCSGGTGIELTHCTIVCDVLDNGDGGGPSANLNLYGDFDHLSNITVDQCFFPATAGGYSVSLGHNPGKPFGSDPTNIVFTNNVLARNPDTGKGGAFGTVTSFLAANGNVYSNNTWADDGSPVPVNA